MPGKSVSDKLADKVMAEVNTGKQLRIQYIKLTRTGQSFMKQTQSLQPDNDQVTCLVKSINLLYISLPHHKKRFVSAAEPPSGDKKNLLTLRGSPFSLSLPNLFYGRASTLTLPIKFLEMEFGFSNWIWNFIIIIIFFVFLFS